jgi:hypothetical protein
MALPKQSTPIYSVIIPSTDERIRFTPFLVKQEKSLLIAQQSEDTIIMLDTLKSIIEECVIDKIDISSLAMFDIEYLMLQLRARSMGEIVELLFSCDVCDDPKAKVQISFDLTNIQVKKDPIHSKLIKLFDNVGVMMKYPGINDIKKYETLDLENIDNIFTLIINSIDYIYDDKEVFHSKDQTKEELHDFINNLTQLQFQKLREFFETMPKLRQDVRYTCPVCKLDHNKYLEGIDTFF